MKKKLISYFLLAAMMTTALASCGDDSGSTKDTKPSDSSDTTPVDTDHDSNGFMLDSLPADINYGGKTFNMLIREDVANTEFFVEEATGEIVDDALFNRNRKVEDRLKVSLNFIPIAGDWAGRETMNGAIRNSVMANDGEYDLCAVLSNQLATLTIEGLLTDLNTLDYVDFDKPWWARGLLDELAVDDKLYFASGDASLGLINGMMCVFYNKQLCEEFNVPNMYEIVNNGEWTIDKVVELTKDVYQDLDGDGLKSVGDRFGFITGSWNQLYGFIDSFNLQILEYDNGYPSTFVFDNERATDAVEKLISLFKDNNEFRTHGQDNNEHIDVFREGRSLFITGEFKDTNSYREISAFDYGVIPMPKYDENQTNYRTTARATYSSFCIPKTAADPNMSAAVLECFASESYRGVSPAYFETALKVKYSRDDETSRMFDIIKESVTFSFGTSFTMAIGDPQNSFKGFIAGLNSGWASNMATNMPQWQEKLNTTLETLRELD
ncbi:MAG: extracellular solute-binding protein [Clostridiales bacterium]|nr:extracellular solute-binding protein [Clostridiales bacterium]